MRDEDQIAVKTFLYSIRDAATEGIGRKLSEEFVQTFQSRYPSALRTWLDDIEASLTHLQLPPFHRITIRTTNLIERSFEEERRRTKVIPRFLDEKACLKLVFVTLWRASQRWRGVKFSQHEQAQISRLRVALGIDDPKQSQEPPVATAPAIVAS